MGMAAAAAVRDACRKHGGFYLASIGGSAANLAEHCIKKVETIEYAELGMEAIWRIEVVDFPAFIVIDDKGNDFFTGMRLILRAHGSLVIQKMTISNSHHTVSAMEPQQSRWRLILRGFHPRCLQSRAPKPTNISTCINPLPPGRGIDPSKNALILKLDAANCYSSAGAGALLGQSARKICMFVG